MSRVFILACMAFNLVRMGTLMAEPSLPPVSLLRLFIGVDY